MSTALPLWLMDCRWWRGFLQHPTIAAADTHPVTCAMPPHCLQHPGRRPTLSGDPQVAGVLLKMRRVHAAAQANGQRTVSMNDMVVAPGADWKV